jgi:hypothetical protein
LADKTAPLLLDALGRAALEPDGVLLHAGKASPGLFGATAAARRAAQRSKEEGLLRVVRTEARGKAVQEVCAITEKGLAYLLSHTSPRRVLEDLVRALEARAGQAGELLATARRAEAVLQSVKTLAEQALRQLGQCGGAAPRPQAATAPERNGSPGCTQVVLEHLGRWQASGASEDCPLPELYRAARGAVTTIGQFHDALRHLHEQGRIYLHPWTGPLYTLPEPPYALLVGHELAYYASLR